MGNEVRIRVTANDDTGRTLKAIEQKFRNFGRKTAEIKITAKDDTDRTFRNVERKFQALARKKAAVLDVTVKEDVDRGLRAAESKVRTAFSGSKRIKIPVEVDVDRTIGSRLRGLTAPFGRSGARAGAAFMAGFVKVVTFGQVGSGFAGMAARMAPKMAGIGAVLGGALATGIILQATNLLTAAMPLVLGSAMLALPIVGLIKPMIDAQKEIDKISTKIATKQNLLIEANERVREAANKKQRAAAMERVKDIKEEIKQLEKGQKFYEKRAEPLIKLTDRFKHFVAEISKPVKVPLLETMKLVGDTLKGWEKPVKQAFATLAPALKPFTQGVLGMVAEFFKAIGREMPNIKAGMEAWGAVMPRIGKTLGDFIAKILRDPEKTKRALEDFAGALEDVATTAGNIINVLQDAADAYGKFAQGIDDAENAGAAGLGKGITAALDDLNVKIDDKIKEVRDKFWKWLRGGGPTKGLEDAFSPDKIKEMNDKIWKWLREGKPADALKEALSEESIKDAINAIGAWGDKVGAGIEKGQDSITEWFKNLGKDSVDAYEEGVNGSAIDNDLLWSALKKNLKKTSDKVIDWFKGLGKDSVDSYEEGVKEEEPKDDLLWDAIKKAVNKAIDKLKELPGKAANAVGSIGDKIAGKIKDGQDKVTAKAKELVNKTVDWIAKLPGKAKNALSSLASKIGSEVEQAKDRVLQKAKDMVNRFIDRMQELVRKAKDQAGRVKGAITDKFTGARDWLYSKGKAVINGLLDGMKGPWDRLKRWVSGIAKWIKDHKGPVSLDRQLLHPAGRALMEGLLGGLKFGFKGVGDFVYKVGGKISDVISKIKDSLMGAYGTGGFKFGKLPSGGYRALGRAMAAAYGWTGANWNALNALWTRESGWNPNARNPSSGAAGIPQDITGNFHGGAVGQIAWGLRYIKGRYGSPLAAWAHSQRTGWYDQGGLLRPGQTGINMTRLPERVLSPAQTRSFDRMVRVMDRSHGGAANTYITVNVPAGFIGSMDQFKTMLVNLNRQGALQVIKK